MGVCWPVNDKCSSAGGGSYNKEVVVSLLKVEKEKIQESREEILKE